MLFSVLILLTDSMTVITNTPSHVKSIFVPPTSILGRCLCFICLVLVVFFRNLCIQNIINFLFKKGQVKQVPFMKCNIVKN